jgi:hypothetical protein
MAMVSTNGTFRRPKGVDLQLTKAWIALPLFFLLLLTATPAVDGEVPTAGDFAACNEEAPKPSRQALPRRSSATTPGPTARDSAMTTIAPAFTGIESADPQIHGMDADGAKKRRVPGRISQLHETERLLGGARRSCRIDQGPIRKSHEVE